MPLVKGHSEADISHNIKEMQAAGHPHNQAVAAALRTAHGYAVGGGIPVAPTGLIDSAVPGRTDKIPAKVPPGSYVIPADVVSGLGEGNTQAGAKKLDAFFNTPGSYALAGQGAEAPAAPVNIVTAGGEYLVKPAAVLAIGHGNMKMGHDVLDAMVRHLRSKIIKKMKSLPGPKR